MWVRPEPNLLELLNEKGRLMVYTSNIRLGRKCLIVTNGLAYCSIASLMATSFIALVHVLNEPSQAEHQRLGYERSSKVVKLIFSLSGVVAK